MRVWRIFTTKSPKWLMVSMSINYCAKAKFREGRECRFCLVDTTKITLPICADTVSNCERKHSIDHSICNKLSQHYCHLHPSSQPRGLLRPGMVSRGAYDQLAQDVLLLVQLALICCGICKPVFYMDGFWLEGKANQLVDCSQKSFVFFYGRVQATGTVMRSPSFARVAHGGGGWTYDDDENFISYIARLRVGAVSSCAQTTVLSAGNCTRVIDSPFLCSSPRHRARTRNIRLLMNQ